MLSATEEATSLKKTKVVKVWFVKNGNFVFQITESRRNHQRCCIKKAVLENFAKYTGKHLYQNLILKKVAGLLQLYQKAGSGTGVFLWILRIF